MTFISQQGDGKPLEEIDGVVPIILEKDKGILQTIGTGCYITRYGLVLTAGHVIDGLKENKTILKTSFVCQLDPNNNTGIFLRKILSACYLEEFDIGVLQVDNFCDKFPENPLINHRVVLSGEVPPEGAILVTYAYPENSEMNFKANDGLCVIKGDYYKGKFLRLVAEPRPYIPYPHYETTIKIKSGASGGPVFYNGKVIGINCRSWDFGEDISDDDNLSSIVPVEYVLLLRVKLLQLPQISFEYKKLQDLSFPLELTLNDLVTAMHIDFRF
jgi:hypothetical protein